MSEVKMGRSSFEGKKHTDSAKAAIGAAQKGKVISPETRALIGAAKTGDLNPKATAV